MNSDIFIVKVELKEGWVEEINSIAKLQASRDVPRKLISTMLVSGNIVLVFEIA